MKKTKPQVETRTPIPTGELTFAHLPINLKRAYQIARVGNHTLYVFADWKYKDYLEVIKGLLPGIKFTDKPNQADMLIEITPPSYEEHALNARCESLPDANLAISLAIKQARYEETGAFKSLLATAARRLALTPEKMEKIKVAACTIARLDRNSEVQIEHLAEAIHYQSDQIDFADRNIYVELTEEEAKQYPKDYILIVPDYTENSEGQVYTPMYLLRIEEAFVTIK